MASTGVQVERWPTERPLFAVSVVVSVIPWLALLVTLIGAMYVLLFARFRRGPPP
jgi:hypothetical protein